MSASRSDITIQDLMRAAFQAVLDEDYELRDRLCAPPLAAAAA